MQWLYMSVFSLFAVACRKNAAVFVVVALPERREDMIIIFIRSKEETPADAVTHLGLKVVGEAQLANKKVQRTVTKRTAPR